MIGGHPIKLGLSRFLTELIENDLITCLATNGTVIIHDFELAAFSETSENVSRWINEGQFGLWQQTDQLNQIVSDGARRDEGFGEAVGRTIEEQKLQQSKHLLGQYFMSRYSRFNRCQIALANLSDRQSDTLVNALAGPAVEPALLRELEAVITAIRLARQNARPVILMIGGHPIKLGLSRFLIELIEAGLVTCIATNGAGIVHDFELAAFGETSENVTRWIVEGQFGLWQQTDQLNQIVTEAASRDEGFGEAVGRHLEEAEAPHRDISVAAAGWRCGIPVTCHVSIGSDIFHGYPNCDGAALGKVSHTDFLIFARQIQDLEGGVFLNIGSAVTGPEVYLKALSMARNVARQNGETITDFTTAVFDVVDLPDNWQDGPGRPPQGKNPSQKPHPLYYFRPWKTILCRTIQDGGKSHYIKGDHRDTIPALWQGLVNDQSSTDTDDESGS